MVPIGDDVKALLQQIPQHVTHDHVFKSLQGSWDEAREQPSLEHVHFHDLRHTWASRQVAAGTGLYELMKLGGWKDFAMVQRYAHFAPEYMQAVANRVNGTTGRAAVAAEVGGGAQR